MLDREIQLLNQLDHPNIVRYYETYDDVYYIYLVMELCTSGELYQHLLSNPKNMTEAYVSLQMSKLLKALTHDYPTRPFIIVTPKTLFIGILSHTILCSTKVVRLS